VTGVAHAVRHHGGDHGEVAGSHVPALVADLRQRLARDIVREVRRTVIVAVGNAASVQSLTKPLSA
jgi:hypothetical protein